MKWRKKIILAKIETTYGTDAVPTGAANAILARDITLTPLVAETVERDNPRPELGAYQKLHVGEHVMLEFDVEMAGSGVVDTPVAYGPLMRMCANAQTINATTSVDYDLVSELEESGSIYFNIDGQQHQMLGCRGSMGLRIASKGIPYWHFMLKGLWVDPATVADPVPVFSAYQAPLHISNDNTPTFTAFGQSLKVASFEAKQNNEVVHRDLVGVEEVVITDRQMDGSISFEAVDLTTFNPFTYAKANTLSALQVVHGTAAGNTIQIDAPQVQLINPVYAESDKKVMINANLAFVPSAGDDEFKITTR